MIGGSHVTQLQGPIKLNLLAEAVHEGEDGVLSGAPSSYLETKLRELIFQATKLRRVRSEERDHATLFYVEMLIETTRASLGYRPLLDIQIPRDAKIIRNDAA